MDDERRQQLLKPVSRVDNVGAIVAGCLWVGIWIGVFFVVGDAAAMTLGLTGTASTIVAIVVPGILSVGWVVFMVRAARQFVQRRRRVREEFTD